MRQLAEFDRLKDHFESFLRRTSPASASSTAALRDAPLLSARALLAGSTSLGKSRLERERDAASANSRDDSDPYKALYPASRLESTSDNVDGLAGSHMAVMREMQDMDDVAELDKRWTSGWQQSIDSRYARSEGMASLAGWLTRTVTALYALYARLCIRSAQNVALSARIFSSNRNRNPPRLDSR